MSGAPTTNHVTLVMGASMVIECILAKEECRLWLEAVEEGGGVRV
jgi:hypothetical protein